MDIDIKGVRFWANVVLSVVLALLGYWISHLFPLPEPWSQSQSDVIYSVLGFLVGVLIFSRLASWVVHVTGLLLRQLISRIALETINQFTNLTSSGITLFNRQGEVNNGKLASLKLSNPVIVDTSAIIDGRVLDVAKTGFLGGVMIIPDFVLRELQQVADSADSLKRVRGRRGFEIVEELKKISGVKVHIWDKDIAGKEVDDKLVRLGRMLKARVLTVDFNLNKVASISNVVVLNLNDLANSLKTLPIPGENLKIRVVHPGKDKTQGVGYLTDGTMIVVKDAAQSVGEDLSIEVTKILQGPAGRMVFARKS